MNRDSVIFGILMGILIPAAVVGLIVGIFYIAGKLPTKELFSSIVILGIAANGLVARFQSKRNMEMAMRGVMAITMLSVLAWVFIFLL